MTTTQYAQNSAPACEQRSALPHLDRIAAYQAAKRWEPSAALLRLAEAHDRLAYVRERGLPEAAQVTELLAASAALDGDAG